MNEIKLTPDHLSDLKDESLRVYLWMSMFLPRYGHEISIRELASCLQCSPATVKRALDLMVEKKYIERQIYSGSTPASYRIIK